MNWKYFKYEDFACKHCGANQMNTKFIDELDEMREECGFAFVITSGYRCPEHNNKVSKTGLNGPHTTGRAVDIRVQNGRERDAIDVASRMRHWTRFGIAKTFVHVDNLTKADGFDERVIWTY